MPRLCATSLMGLRGTLRAISMSVFMRDGLCVFIFFLSVFLFFEELADPFFHDLCDECGLVASVDGGACHLPCVFFCGFVAKGFQTSDEEVSECFEVCLFVNSGKRFIDEFFGQSFAPEHEPNFDASPMVEAIFVGNIGASISFIVHAALFLQ